MDHFYGSSEGGDDVGGIGLTLPCDIESCTMIHARSDAGNAQGYIDSVPKMQELKGSQSLIVIHAHQPVELTL